MMNRKVFVNGCKVCRNGLAICSGALIASDSFYITKCFPTISQLFSNYFPTMVDDVDAALLDAAMCDMDSCLEQQQQVRSAEEARLRESTDPAEHLCGPNCPYLYIIESQRETTDHVCPISNLTWGGDLKWDPVLAGRCEEHSAASSTPFSKRFNEIITIPEECPLPMTEPIPTERDPAPRTAPRSTRENDLLGAHYALRSMAEHNIYGTLERMKPENRNVSQIRQELLAAQEHDRARNVHPFTLIQLNDIQIEARRRALQSEQRVLLHKHVLQKSMLVKQFVNILAQLFSTLWIIITHNQIRRRELESFKSFVQSLLNCLHRGMRISNQPILPQGILFFNDTKRKHRSDSAHYALQQVQQVLGTLDSASKTEHFQQCIRLSRQLEVIHEKLLQNDFKGLTGASSCRDMTSSGHPTCSTSGS